MESGISTLEKRISEFLDVLSQENTGDSTGNKSDQIHVELIDFDDLVDTLTATKTTLQAIEHQNYETAAVRQWFVGRIKSMRRGRELIARQTFSTEEFTTFDDVSLAELLRQFEYETAALKETAGMTDTPSALLSTYRQHKYRQYKS